jgi:hypothetical protein
MLILLTQECLQITRTIQLLQMVELTTQFNRVTLMKI